MNGQQLCSRGQESRFQSHLETVNFSSSSGSQSRLTVQNSPGLIGHRSLEPCIRNAFSDFRTSTIAAYKIASLNCFGCSGQEIFIDYIELVGGRIALAGNKSTVSTDGKSTQSHVPDKDILEHSLMSQQDVGISGPHELVRVVQLASGTMQRGIASGFLQSRSACSSVSSDSIRRTQKQMSYTRAPSRSRGSASRSCFNVSMVLGCIPSALPVDVWPARSSRMTT